MGFIGNNLKNVLTEAKSVDTMTGDGSTTTITLSKTPGSVNNTTVFWDGVFKTPITDYTLSGTTITFGTAPAQDVHVMVFSGNDSLVESPENITVTSSMIADGSITSDKIATVDINKLDGTLPAGVDASALTGMPDLPSLYTTVSASSPTRTSNPTGGVGTMWINSTDGELFVCVDAGTDNNEWRNVGESQESDNVAPAPQYLGDIGMWMGGYTGTGFYGTDNTHSMVIPTQANTVLFGSTTYGHGDMPGVCSNGTRAVVAGGWNNHNGYGRTPVIEYVTIATPGNATWFGNLTWGGQTSWGTQNIHGTGNGTRGIYNTGAYGGSSGAPSPRNMQYITVETPANAQDFTSDNMTYGGGQHRWQAICSNGVRCVIWNGYYYGDETNSGNLTGPIRYINMDTTSNSISFGNQAGRGLGGVGLNDRTYGVSYHNKNGWTQCEPAEYLTMATEANAQFFANQYSDRYLSPAVCTDTASRAVIKSGFSAGWGGVSGTAEMVQCNKPDQNAVFWLSLGTRNHPGGASGNG